MWARRWRLVFKAMQDYYNDRPFMELALAEARLAAAEGEVPVGAVVVQNGRVIATGRNRRENDRNALAHAECEAIRSAGLALGNWRLTGCTLYVTLEPCPMCAGAIINARVDRVVYGAADPAGGCAGSLINLFALDLPHRPALTTGVLAEECRAVLAAFFQTRRRPEGESFY